MKPMPVPMTRAAMMARTALSVVLKISALTTPMKAYMEPTERSMSPSRIIMNMPIAEMPVTDT